MVLRLLAVTYVLFNTLVAAVGCTLVVGLGYGTVAAVCMAVGFQPRRLSHLIMDATLSLFCGHMQLFGGLQLSVFGERMRKERALLVCNHRSWVDTAVICCLAYDARALHAMRFVADRQLLSLPVFGAMAGLLDAVFLIERKAALASAPLSRAYRRLRAYAAQRRPYWLVVYAEGFLRSDVKLAEARRFAEDRGLKPLRHLLQPRTKGFVAALKALHPEIDAIYDVTVAYGTRPYDEVTPSFKELYLEPVAQGEKRNINVLIERIPIDQVPVDDEEEVKDWLYKLYEKKDDTLERFYERKSFDEQQVEWYPIEKRDLLRAVAKCAGTFVAFVGALVVLTIKLRYPQERILPSLLAR